MKAVEEQQMMKSPALNLPDEVWTDIILLKLPFDSLVSLSRSCKAWRDLIRNNPYFIEKHINKNKSNDPLMFFRSCSKDITQDLIYSSSSKNKDPSLLSSRRRTPLRRIGSGTGYMKSIGSCNGVVCLVDTFTQAIYLCNPGTEEERQLPQDKLEKTLRAIGFGFDASTKDYKVVVSGGRVMDFRAYVYKLSTDCWSELNCREYSDLYLAINGVHLNGIYHWWMSTYIITFDFETEIFGSMRFLNEDIRNRSGLKCMGVLDDSLAICFWEPSGNVDLWMMTEYGNKESWMKKYSVYLSSFFNVTGFWLFPDMKKLFFMVGNHVTVEACSVGRESEKLRSRRLLEIDLDGSQFMAQSGVFFQPSLVSLRSLQLV